MKMIRLLFIVIVLGMAFSAAGCRKPSESGENISNSAQDAAVDSTANEASSSIKEGLSR
jgi:hypothetical protein